MAAKLGDRGEYIGIVISLLHSSSSASVSYRLSIFTSQQFLNLYQSPSQHLQFRIYHHPHIPTTNPITTQWLLLLSTPLSLPPTSVVVAITRPHPLSVHSSTCAATMTLQMMDVEATTEPAATSAVVTSQRTDAVATMLHALVAVMSQRMDVEDTTKCLQERHLSFVQHLPALIFCQILSHETDCFQAALEQGFLFRPSSWHFEDFLLSSKSRRIFGVPHKISTVSQPTA